MTVKFYFIKKRVLVSNTIITIPETFRFLIQTLILIEIDIFSHSKSSVHRPIFVYVISSTAALFGKLFGSPRFLCRLTAFIKLL